MEKEDLFRAIVYKEVSMRFAHISDLHIGKRVNGFSMIPDQRHVLSEIASAIRGAAVDAVFISGDVYDKSVPSAEAVELFDSFLVSLKAIGIPIFVISGNHDSAERIAFASRILDGMDVHMSPVYSGRIAAFEVGDVSVFMLPFVRPADVRPFFPDEEILTYSDALRAAISQIGIDSDRVNVLLAHQFVMGASTSDSEDAIVGGLEGVDVSVFDPFDYVALGHLHRPQSIGRNTVRYSGSPLKYSFSEVSDNKSITVVDICGKGKVKMELIPIIPLHEMREIKGSFFGIISGISCPGMNYDDYMHITLTDDDDIPNCLEKLRKVYPNIMKLDYDNSRTKNSSEISMIDSAEKRSPIEIFSDFYFMQNGVGMSDEEKGYVSSLMDDIAKEDGR